MLDGMKFALGPTIAARRAEHDTGAHCRVLNQDLLDGRRRDFAARDVDLIARATAQMDEAILQFSQVTGLKSSRAQRVRRLRPIRLADSAAAHGKTAVLFQRQTFGS